MNSLPHLLPTLLENTAFALLFFGGRLSIFAAVFIPPALLLLALGRTTLARDARQRHLLWLAPFAALLAVIAVIALAAPATDALRRTIDLTATASVCFFSFHCGYLIKNRARYAITLLFPAALLLYWWILTTPPYEKFITEMIPALIAAPLWSLAFAALGASAAKLLRHHLKNT